MPARLLQHPEIAAHVANADHAETNELVEERLVDVGMPDGVHVHVPQPRNDEAAARVERRGIGRRCAVDDRRDRIAADAYAAIGFFGAARRVDHCRVADLEGIGRRHGGAAAKGSCNDEGRE